MKGYVMLEDGTVLEGQAFGGAATVAGDFRFHTDMSGCGELFGDPANSGQILVMTYPLQGNCGLSREDMERNGVAPLGVIVKDFSHTPGHYQCEKTIREYFTERGIFGLAYVDTRMLARKAARGAAGKCCLTAEEPRPGLIEQYYRPAPAACGGVRELTRLTGDGANVSVLDLGSSRGLLAQLRAEGANVSLFPHEAKAAAILAENPDCVIISHGGGDPRALPHVAETVTLLGGGVPVYGVGMGALALGMVMGMEAFRLPVGRGGANYPVIHASTGKVTITAQNMMFGLRRLEVPNEALKTTYNCLNDGGIQGFQFGPYEGVLFTPGDGIVAGWLRAAKNGSGRCAHA